MSRTGRHTGTPAAAGPTRRRPGSTGARWLVATLGVLVLGLVALVIGAWSLSRPDPPVTPWGPGGGVILGPMLLGIAIAELLRRWRRSRRRGPSGRHAGRP